MQFNLSTIKGRESAKSYIDSLPFPKEGGKTHYTADIKRTSLKRTISQNRLYWLWIACIHAETGQDKDEVHDILRSKFLGVDRVTAFGIECMRIRSTKELNTRQMRHYLDCVQAFAATELDIMLPDPSAPYWDSFVENYSQFI